jgi:LuxR family maltose regulon positive regulatory protein
MPETLLRTKLTVPTLRPSLVLRPQLIERLNQGLQLGHKLTLISAPAGFGKTTLVSEWVSTLDHSVAWLSLDAGDDDPGRFIVYFVAALQEVDPNLGREIESVLHSGQLPPGEIIGATLVNDMLELESRFLLVLDDFHVIQDAFVLQVLEQLIANLPPPLHLVLITREDPPLPLARLRANNQLSEIRARELRFAGPDTERFLNEVLGLSLAKTDVAALEDKTEGWIVGLQLAAIALGSSQSTGDEADPSGFIAALSGSHRFILDYLTEQVLDQQPEEIRRFLLQTAILDKLNGDLCNAVTERSDGRAVLERLFKANLFLISLDDEGRWYRYHHLFADLLRERQHVLGMEETAACHRRASQWYARREMASEAIRHALSAGDYTLAVDLLERHAMQLIMRGYVKTVNGWVQSIPEEWRSQSPRTNLAFAWMHLLRGAYSQAAPYLEGLEDSLPSARQNEVEGRSLRAEWLVMRSLLLNREGRSTESLAMAREALEIVPEQENRVRSLAYFGLASAYRAMKEYEPAADAYQMAIQYGQAANNPVAEMLSISGLAVMAFERGQLHLAFEIAAPVSGRAEQSGAPPPISTVVYGILGEVYYQWHQTEEARRHFLHALHLSTLGGYGSGMIGCRVLLSRLSLLEGDLEAAGREIQLAIDLLQVDTPDYVWQEAISQQVRLYLARDRSLAAQMALRGQGFSFQGQFSYPEFPPAQGLTHANGLMYSSSLSILLHQVRAGHDLATLRQGNALADHLVAGARQSQHVIVMLEALLLRAQMRAVLGDREASEADYASALQLGEPEGFIGLFVEQGSPVAESLASLARRNRLGTVRPEYVERILNAFWKLRPAELAGDESPAADQPAATVPAALVEPLTGREMEVLRLMAEGLKYKEIADQLFISLNTVRYHVKTIYGKLNVNNRTQAIETARQLRIL